MEGHEAGRKSQEWWEGAEKKQGQVRSNEGDRKRLQGANLRLFTEPVGSSSYHDCQSPEGYDKGDSPFQGGMLSVGYCEEASEAPLSQTRKGQWELM